MEYIFPLICSLSAVALCVFVLKNITGSFAKKGLLVLGFLGFQYSLILPVIYALFFEDGSSEIINLNIKVQMGLELSFWCFITLFVGNLIEKIVDKDLDNKLE